MHLAQAIAVFYVQRRAYISLGSCVKEESFCSLDDLVAVYYIKGFESNVSDPE